MKFAPVCPIHIYEALADAGDEYIGNYFLLLAHDVLANAERYAKFFANRDCTIIMDNSVIELGDACNAKNLLEACDIVKADVLVIPDVLENGHATLEAGRKFLRDTGELWLHTMFVPQGADLDDYYNCVHDAAHDPLLHNVNWVGIARNLTGRVFPSRRIPVAFCAMEFPTVKLHMLGFSCDSRDDIETCVQNGAYISGIDSAVPLRLASAGMSLGDPIHEPGPRGKWWDECHYISRMANHVLETRKRLEY